MATQRWRNQARIAENRLNTPAVNAHPLTSRQSQMSESVVASAQPYSRASKDKPAEPRNEFALQRQKRLRHDLA